MLQEGCGKLDNYLEFLHMQMDVWEPQKSKLIMELTHVGNFAYWRNAV